MRRLFFLASLIGAGLGAGCGSNSASAIAPIGTWTYSGHVPAIITIALTFNPDGTFTAAEQVAPATTPAGSPAAPGCATTDSYAGTYGVSEADGHSTVTWSYDTGTVNAVEGCDDASLDRAGTAATPDGIASFTEQNILPPATEAYTQAATTLVLTPGFEGTSGTGTVFTKSP
jgi:hypothetical protein